MFETLYCSQLYRHKKVKKYLEGFIDVKDGKWILYDEQKKTGLTRYFVRKLQKMEWSWIWKDIIVLFKSLNPPQQQ